MAGYCALGTLNLWRHARPAGVEGRCIGRVDVVVDKRKSKRLAHRIRTWARRNGTPAIIITSPLARCAAVGRHLAAWGWAHRVDARLSELDFGTWDGQRWDQIDAASVDAWTRDFADHRPGGGESVAQLIARCNAFTTELQGGGDVCVVTHAGWISAAVWTQRPEAGALSATSW